MIRGFVALDVREVRVYSQDGVDMSAPNREGVAEDAPTIFHITHWKAGSQWIHKILVDCVPERIIPPQLREAQFLDGPLQPQKVYPTVYVTKQQFDSVRLPSNWRRFVIIRDLRDTLVSAYFSLKVSHAILDYRIARWRSVLQSLSMEDGLIYLIDEYLPRCASIQVSWLQAGERLLRYEDLLENDLDILEQVLLDECELPVSRERFREVVRANRFEQLTKGRLRGQEDRIVHERKGIAGDWRNYFSDRVTRAFNERFGGLLVATGYDNEKTVHGRHSSISSDGSKLAMLLDEAYLSYGYKTTSLGNYWQPVAVEQVLTERVQSLMNQVVEKQTVIQELHTEAERRREALEVVTTDRDAWETRYRQLTAASAAPQTHQLQLYIQRISHLERALEEKEKVIQDLHAEAERRREALEEIDRTLRRERAERAKEPEA